MTKIQLTLTTQEANLLATKAAQLGYNLTRYIKYLISREAIGVADNEVPMFKMSPKAEKVALKALVDYKAGKTKKIKSFKELES